MLGWQYRWEAIKTLACTIPLVRYLNGCSTYTHGNVLPLMELWLISQSILAFYLMYAGISLDTEKELSLPTESLKVNGEME